MSIFIVATPRALSPSLPLSLEMLLGRESRRKKKEKKSFVFVVCVVCVMVVVMSFFFLRSAVTSKPLSLFCCLKQLET